MKTIIALSVFLLSTSCYANEEYDLGNVSGGHIIIKGRIQNWTFTKVCIGDQVYILVNGLTGPNGMTVAYKNGVPERCSSNSK